MYKVHKLLNANASYLTASGSADTLEDAITTAGGGSSLIPTTVDSFDLLVESGSIRALWDGNDPTASRGMLYPTGSLIKMRGVKPSKFKMIKAEAGNALLTVQVGHVPVNPGGQPIESSSVSNINQNEISVAIDEFPASSVGTDNEDDPDTTSVKAFPYVYDGTSKWKKLRGGISAVVSSIAGFLNTMPYGMYQSSPATLTNGQGAPMPLDSSQNLKVAVQNLAAVTQTGTLAGAGQVVGPFDVTAYKAMAFVGNGTFSLTWIAEHSMDGGTTWEALPMHQESQFSTIWQTGATGATVRQLNCGLITGQVRIRCSAYVSGSMAVNLLLFPNAAVPNTQNVVGLLNGAQAHDAVATSANIPFLMAGVASNQEPTAVSATGDITRLWTDRYGRTLVKQATTIARISTATTTVVVGVQCIAHKIIVPTALTGAVTVYNSNGTGGAVIALLPIGYSGTLDIDAILTAITVVTAGADQVLVTTTQ